MKISFSLTRMVVGKNLFSKGVFIVLIYLVFAVCLNATSVESSISSSYPYAHASNAGWINFRPSAENGTQVHESFLSGYAYAANFGWINFGDGSPENGYSYSNNGPLDYGVNLAEDGSLSGYAYAPNIGWITFEGHWGQPYLNFSTGKFVGFAYSGNIGWISLDTDFSDLVAAQIVQPTDSDNDGIADYWEMQFFGNLTEAGVSTDADSDGVTDLKEYLAGTDPNDQGSRFRIVSHTYNLNNSTATIEFTTVKNRLYRIDYDDDLQGTWTDSGHGLFSNSLSSITTKTFPYTSGNKRFFRVQSIKPLQP
jgi:hypothetical protein